MRIMYIQPGEVLGGAERQAVVYISKLRHFGIRVVPVVGPSDAIGRALEGAGVTDYVHLPEFFHPTFDRGGSPLDTVRSDLREVGRYFRTQREIERIIRSRPVDLILASRILGWGVATGVARRLGLPIVWRAGGCTTSRAQELGMRLFSALWRPPDALICNSEAVRADLGAFIPCPSYIIKNGVDMARFHAARTPPRVRQELGLDLGTPVVAMVARPGPTKNLELLAEVVTRVAREVPDVRVLIAGDSAAGARWARYDWRQHYQRLYERLGLAGRVTFLGHRDDIEYVYSSADVAVLTSRSEGSPNAILEAMAMERPVVATRVDGLPEIVEHGVHGFLPPPDDAEAFAGYLVALLRDPALRARMGAAGRAAIQARFSDLAATERLADLLHRVAGLPAGAAVPEEIPSRRRAAG